MSATFTWSVISMLSYPQADGYTDVVFQVNWMCQAIQVEGDKTYASSVANVQSLMPPTGSFTPYDQLTQEQVLGWVWAVVPQAGVEAKLQQDIDDQISPPVVELPLPWAPQPVPASA